ncbi:MAG: signal recognition particle protein [Armatimonadota bacterium]|nr:MAG: signal recognition particle protein [Armatimonadota bacterium]
MFESLTEKLQKVFRRLSNQGKVTEQDVQEALREVRIALLEADVHFKVVKDFIARVRERAVGQEVLQSLTATQQVIKIVHEELVSLLGDGAEGIRFAPKPPTVILLCGLQGSGKTTTAAKLALWLRKQGRRPLLVAADVHRPAAVQQLKVLGQSLQVPVFVRENSKDAVRIAHEALQYAVEQGHDVVILDTAGRLHIDNEMMDEVRRVKEATQPNEILLVLDAMTGQDAVRVAEEFHRHLEVDGFILTKLDGDTRGGAAISIRAVVGKPIKFVGVGEKPDALDVFHPDRMAGRILGMGDVLTLIEKAQQTFDQKQVEELQRKLRQNQFDLNDFLMQMRQMQQMGPLDQLLKMIPGLGSQLQNVQIDPKELKRVEAIILSMTPEERANPHILNASRKRRIARGSGTTVHEVNELLSQFEEMRHMIRELNALQSGGGKGKRKVRLPFFG